MKSLSTQSAIEKISIAKSEKNNFSKNPAPLNLQSKFFRVSIIQPFKTSEELKNGEELKFVLIKLLPKKLRVFVFVYLRDYLGNIGWRSFLHPIAFNVFSGIGFLLCHQLAWAVSLYPPAIRSGTSEKETSRIDCFRGIENESIRHNLESCEILNYVLWIYLFIPEFAPLFFLASGADE